MWRPELAPAEVMVRAAIIYAFVQLLFRAVGRKEIGRWGLPEVALLFLVTTSVRTSIVGDDASLTSAMIGLSTIVGLDRCVSTLAARSRRAANVLEGPVRQLVRDGAPQEAVMRRTRVSQDDLLARAREQGRGTLHGLADAYLERSGRITLVFRGGS
jgi:uncharacterized membrane protein YcaP (DUF421 family)